MHPVRHSRSARTKTAPPTLTFELELARAHGVVAGMDEVGRGALAGPVCVGVCLVDASTPPAPAGLRDSKELTPRKRAALAEVLPAWTLGHSLGWASAAEVDKHGIVGALRLAGTRALAEVAPTPGVVILDGTHNWLDGPDGSGSLPTITKAKADQTCASVAAASVLAKVSRDALMSQLDSRFPAYRWAANKGYGSAEHLEALRQQGPCAEHRRTFKLPNVRGWQRGNND
jgi:ribonuclease HII